MRMCCNHNSGARLLSFASVWGANWLTGRALFPVLKQWGRHETGIVLDVGCGESPFRQFFPHLQKYIRVDRVPVDEEVIVADINHLPFGDDSVDTVLLFQVLADSPEPGECLREIARVCKPGGNLIVFESMCFPEHDLPNDYFRLMPAGVEYLAQQSGFNLQKTIRLGGLFSRFALLWNNVIMAKLQKSPLLRWLGATGTLASNVCCYALDRLYPSSALASDYVARFTKVSSPYMLTLP
jgi:SAM-dependent methyltransferase